MSEAHDDDLNDEQLIESLRSSQLKDSKTLADDLVRQGKVPEHVATLISGGEIEQAITVLKANTVNIYRSSDPSKTHRPRGTNDPFALLCSTRIYIELASRISSSPIADHYIRSIDNGFSGLKQLLCELSPSYQSFESGILAHSTLTLDAAGRLLTDKQISSVTDTDLFLLIAGSLLQDVSIVTAPSFIAKLRSDDAFTDTVARVVSTYGLDAKALDLSRGVGRLLALAHIYQNYSLNSCMPTSVDQECKVLSALCSEDATVREHVSKLLLSLSVPFLFSQEISQLQTNVRISTQSANAYFVASLLRIGAILDIHTARVSPVLSSLPDVIAILGEEYWKNRSGINVTALAPNASICFTGISPTQDAERHLQDWMQYLQDECEQAVLTLNSCDPPYPLAIGRISSDFKADVDESGRPKYEFHRFRFNLDEEQVFHRLFGKRLYGRIDAALRELIQNAIDATRVRVAHECRRSSSWNDMNEAERKECFANSVKQRADELAIRIWSTNDRDPVSGQLRSWIHVADKGIGMSRDVIQRFLLKVGRTRWREDPDVRTLGIGTVGEFGIGFLSCFMVSDRTVIETLSCLPDEIGVKATVFSWKGYLATEPSNPASYGTTISMQLKPQFEESAGNLSELVAYWCPFPEVPILVNDDQSIEPIDTSGEAGWCDRLNSYCFPVNQSGTLASLNKRPSKQDKNPVPSLYQDGFAIPEVPPPILETPEQELLRRLGLRLNLRGQDRLPLDLSRNLVEGGADELWKGIIPGIWNAFVRQCTIHKQYRKTFARLNQATFESSRGRVLFTIGKDRQLDQVECSEIDCELTLDFLDQEDDRLRRIANTSDQLLLLPDPPLAMLVGPAALRDDIYGDETLDLSRDSPELYWSKKGGHIEARMSSGHNSADQPSDSLSLRVLNSFDGTIFRLYKYASQSTTGSARLSTRKFSSCILLSRLGFLRLSREWNAIRSPLDGSWRSIHSSDASNVLGRLPSEVLAGLGFEDYVLCILNDTWPNSGLWEAGWPGDATLSSRMINAKNRRQKQLDAIASSYDQSVEQESDPHQEEDEYAGMRSTRKSSESLQDDRRRTERLDMIENEDPFFESRYEHEVLDATESRIVARHGVHSLAEYEEASVEFAAGVLPLLAKSKIRSCLAPWDIKWWEEYRTELLEGRSKHAR